VVFAVQQVLRKVEAQMLATVEPALANVYPVGQLYGFTAWEAYARHVPVVIVQHAVVEAVDTVVVVIAAPM
jgi:hypothetical protein